ncbi:MAG TPA: NAD(P)-dependent oxidoreductase, partial [Bacteroidales bacterium]|nr:NAD(P)-dependent oxidoreductase [Bacteroidales bacterium]
MNILVTGGSGFIGTNLVNDLLNEGHNVTIYDKLKSETYPDLCIVADVRDKEQLTRCMR